jgi:hypothetical protein
MKVLSFLFLMVYSTVFSQAKMEIQEFTGELTSIKPGWGFAIEGLELSINGEARYFRIDPIHGKEILTKLQIGKPLSLKANVNITARENYKKLNKSSTAWGFRFTDSVTEIFLDNKWVQTPVQSRKTLEPPSSYQDFRVILEQKVIGDYYLDGIRKGLIFPNGLIAFASYANKSTMSNASPGKRISFIGYETTVKEEYIFPIPNVKKVYSFMELNKHEGRIESFIYKQNFARIGMVINGKRLSFPTEYAKQIETLANDEKLIVYYNGEEDIRLNSLPTIHAIIFRSDTLYIPGLYYGGPDGRHEHKESIVSGTLEKINRTSNGQITSLIINKEAYIEIDAQTASQLSSLLKKGVQIIVLGDERIKKEGEIYEREYRIITPKRITIDGKEFILNQ